MKTHLPILLRLALLATFLAPAQASLTWNSGQWNSTDESWLQNNAPAAFQNGDAVEFTADASGFLVLITETVEPASVTITGGDYTFSGSGGSGGETAVSLHTGSSLVIQNANSYSGGTTLAAGAVLELNQYHSAGSANASESALGTVSGEGLLRVNLASQDTQAAIIGSAMQEFTGTLHILQGTVGLGRTPGHGGAGQAAQLGAAMLWVDSGASFVTSMGGGRASLNTGNSFSADVKCASGSTLGNRDGYINWTGNINLNLQDVTAESPVYDSSGVVELGLYYGKYIVWDGIVSGRGTLELTTGAPDTNTDHRLVLTNGENSFSGTYLINAQYVGSLALAAADAAADATVRLETATSRLVLMNSDATLASLGGAAGVVFAEGGGSYTLSIGSGAYSGNIVDSVSSGASVQLGISMTGTETLSLVGGNCTYSGATTVQSGAIQFSGSAALGDVRILAATARCSVAENLTLNSSASLSLCVSGSTEAVLQCGGEFVLSDAVHGVTVSGYESLGVGVYTLISWGAASTVENTMFAVSGLNDTSDYHYSTAVNGNSFQLVVSDMNSVPWLWQGGSATWSDSSSAEWANAAGSGPAGQSVTFSVQNAGVVSIQQVTPANILVSGGEYEFAAATDDAPGIVSSGRLAVSGDATVLQVNLSNSSFTGLTELLGGVLEINAENALGSSAILFNGGCLRYGSGMVQDISSQVGDASTSVVMLDTNGNDVAWAAASGVGIALSHGISKLGAGTWTLTWSAAGEAYTGNIEVNGGTLIIDKPTGNGSLSGSFSGSGTIQLSSAAGLLSVQANNSAFAGVLLLSGNGEANAGSVRFLDGNAMGGNGTQVQLAGLRFWFASNTTTNANLEIMAGHTTYFDGTTGNTYNFTGSVSGSGTMVVKPSSHISMSGDISAFSGRFEHPGNTAVTWLLGGAGAGGAGLVQADLHSTGSNMVYEFNYTEPTTMSGAVSGGAQLLQSGSGLLTLTGNNTTSGVLSISPDAEVQLGSAQVSGVWSGTTVDGGGQFTLVNGALANGLSSISGVLVAAVAAGAVVDMGGMDANVLESISISAGGLLTGISGDLNVGTAGGVDSLSLTFAPANIGAAPGLGENEQVMLEMEVGALVLYDSASVNLDMETIKSILEGKRQAVYLHVANVAIELQNNMTALDLFANSATTPAALGLAVLGVEGGNIVLEGAVRDVYMVTQDGDYPTVTDYDRLQPYKATFIDEGYTLSLQLAGDNTQLAWVNNLLGYGDFSVENTDQSSGVVRILLNNEVLGALAGTLPPTLEEDATSANTELLGSISAGNAVQLVKTGSGTLTVGGNLVADWLEVDEGSLQLRAAGNVVQSLHGDGAVVLLAGSALQIASDALAYAGSLSGSGELSLGGSFPARGTVGSLSGDGNLVAVGGSFVVQNVRDAAFSGTLTGDAQEGVLTVASGGGTFTMNRVSGSRLWSVQNEGRMVFRQSDVQDNAILELNELRLLNGSESMIVLNSDYGVEVFSLSGLLIEDGAVLQLQSDGKRAVTLDGEGRAVMGTVEDADLGTDGVALLTLIGDAAFQGISAAWLTVENGQLIFHARRNEANRYAQVTDSANAWAGAQMLWRLPNRLLAQSPDLAALTQTLDQLLTDGQSAAASDLLAAAAGAATAVLSPVLLGDVERQLKTIRNRTTTMGLDPAYDYENLPMFNAWIQAEGDQRDSDACGTAAGYRVSTWGGTVGVDLDMTTAWTAGLAFSAMYGDITPRSADAGSGDSDVYYLSFFGRYAANRWTHTMVGTMGMADVSMRRYVNHEQGGYESKGSTHGFACGLLYEVGYVIPVDDDMQTCIQPIVNVSFRYAGVRGYREHGSDASLYSGAQSMKVATFGLGARAQTYAFENLYNRMSLVEARFLLKLDAGDRQSHHMVALLADVGRGGRVISAKQGVFGLEAGAGITLPLGMESSHLFLDAGVELRAGAVEVNGSVGYRQNF